MRFLLYVSLLLAIVPLIFLRPFFGLCVYYVVSLLQPKYLCWRGDFQDAMIVGIPLVAGAVALGVPRQIVQPRLHPRAGRVVGVIRRIGRAPLFDYSWPFLCMIVLLGVIAVNRFIAPFPMGDTAYQFRSLCKVVLVTGLLMAIAADSRRLRALYVVIALSAGFWAIKGGIKVLLLGPHQVYGKTYDNNIFALLSVMALPMIFYFGLSVRQARWRTLLLICSALTSLAIIGSRSRAGFAAFVVVVACMAWNSRYRFRALVAVLVVGAVSFLTAGGEIRERIDSIVNYTSDISARGRFATWHQAIQLVSTYPLTGVGFNNFERARAAVFGGARAAHNIYLQNLAELGFIGHALWLLLILGTLASLYRLMRRARRLPSEYRWAYYLARGLVLALLAFCIHGMFHNEEYLEYMFAIVGLSVALRAALRRVLYEDRLVGLVQSQRVPRRAAGAFAPAGRVPSPSAPVTGGAQPSLGRFGARHPRPIRGVVHPGATLAGRVA